MNNFSFDFTPTESPAGGILLYIAHHISHKPHLDLNIYKSNGLDRAISRVFLGTPFFEMVIFPCRHNGCMRIQRFFGDSVP